MKLLVVWILMSAVTYWFTKYSRFGKNVFQHDLKVEGSERDVIAFFCVMFAAAWPLWWLLMLPVCICIGRKESRGADPTCTRTRAELVRVFRTNADDLWGEVERLSDQHTAHAEHLRNKARYYDWAWENFDQSLNSLEKIHSARPEKCKSCPVRRCIFKKIEDLLEVAEWSYPKNK